MSNVFIMINNNTFIPNKTTSKLITYCIEYGFLWMGTNTFGKYHIHQYRGSAHNMELFIDKCKTIFSKYAFSIIYKDQDFLHKLSENDITIMNDTSLISYINHDKFITTSIQKKDLLFFLSNCHKKDNKYYFTFYYKSIIGTIPRKIFHEAYCTISSNNTINIYSTNICVIKNIEVWFERIMQLYKKL